jgi:hypothetical protein
MPRDKNGKNRKFGHHKEKGPGNLSEEDILKMLSKKKANSDDENEEENSEKESEEEEGK